MITVLLHDLSRCDCEPLKTLPRPPGPVVLRYSTAFARHRRRLVFQLPLVCGKAGFAAIFKYCRKTFVQRALICYLFAVKPDRTLLTKKGEI
jgi:hypothetical protein